MTNSMLDKSPADMAQTALRRRIVSQKEGHKTTALRGGRSCLSFFWKGPMIQFALVWWTTSDTNESSPAPSKGPRRSRVGLGQTNSCFINTTNPFLIPGHVFFTSLNDKNQYKSVISSTLVRSIFELKDGFIFNQSIFTTKSFKKMFWIKFRKVLISDWAKTLWKFGIFLST